EPFAGHSCANLGTCCGGDAGYYKCEEQNGTMIWVAHEGAFCTCESAADCGGAPFVCGDLLDPCFGVPSDTKGAAPSCSGQCGASVCDVCSFGGVCWHQCFAPADCPSGSACDDTHHCVMNTCQADPECPALYPCNDGGYPAFGKHCLRKPCAG